MKRVVAPAAVLAALAIVLLGAPAAHASDAAGAGFYYDTGTGRFSVRIFNHSDANAFTGIDLVLTGSTTFAGSPNFQSNGACNQVDATHVHCSSTKGPGAVGFIDFTTVGGKADVDWATQFAGGGSASGTATECGEVGASPGTLPDGTAGSPYSAELTPSGGTAPYTFSLSGVSPGGLTLSPSGAWSGTPATGGTFNFNVVVRDYNGCTATLPYTIEVKDADLKADLDVVSIHPGSFVEKESNEDDYLNSVLAMLAYRQGEQLFGGSSAFRRFNIWNTGEIYEVDVRVVNHGPDPATSFGVGVSGLGIGLDYVGYLTFDDLSGDEVLHPGKPPLPLAPGKAVRLVYRGRLSSPGTHTVSATVHPRTPRDPKATNNHRSIGFQVLGQPAYSNVRFHGEAIEGRAAKPTGSGAALRAAAVSGLPKVDIAVRRKGKKGCSWLRGSSGEMQKPKPGRCQKAVFLKAKGTGHWHFDLDKRPAKGKYRVFVRPRRSPPEANAWQFGPKHHNAFKVKIG